MSFEGCDCGSEGAYGMAFVAIDAGVFCRGREVADGVRERLGAGELTDEELYTVAARSGIEQPIRKLMYGPHSLLDGFRKDQARLIAHLKAAMATIGDEPAFTSAGPGTSCHPP